MYGFLLSIFVSSLNPTYMLFNKRMDIIYRKEIMSQFFIWMSLLKQGKNHQLSSFNLWMIRAGSAKDASCKGHNLTTPFIHVFKIFVNQKGFFFGGGCFVLFFLAVYGPEKILSLATPTLQSQPMRQSVADGACPWYFVSYICPFTLRRPTAVAIVPEKLVNASRRKTF